MHTEPLSTIFDDVDEEPTESFESLPPLPVASAQATPSTVKSEREPAQIFDALAEDSRDAFIAKWEAEHRRSPETTFKLGVCRHCGTSLGNTEDDKVIPIRTMFLPNVCCVTCSEKGKARLEQEAADERAKSFAGVIPTEFLRWDTAKGNNQALEAARGKFSISARRGVILHGPSGRCKTRIMWELVKQVASDKDGFSFLVLDAFEASTTGIPKDAYTCDFLFIDDLGNEPKSVKFETQLLHLFRRRFDWHRPIVITTQLTGREFMDRFFSGAAAQAIARRIKENCADVPCSF